MTKKKKTAEQRAAEIKHLRMMTAGFIKDRYPFVKTIQLCLEFHDSESGREESKETRNLLPEHSALFELPCGYWECVQGGFDLGAPIDTMLTKRQPSISGELVCQGWQDRERIEKHRCLRKLIYRVNAEYA